jgi:hypothetical protein
VIDSLQELIGYLWRFARIWREPMQGLKSWAWSAVSLVTEQEAVVNRLPEFGNRPRLRGPQSWPLRQASAKALPLTPVLRDGLLLWKLGNCGPILDRHQQGTRSWRSTDEHRFSSRYAFAAGVSSALDDVVLARRNIKVCGVTAPVSPLGILDQEPEPASRAEPLRTLSEAGPELAIVVPTLNERDNVGPLIDRLDRLLVGVDWEAVFVDDDSADGTANTCKTSAGSIGASAASADSAGAD